MTHDSLVVGRQLRVALAVVHRIDSVYLLRPVNTVCHILKFDLAFLRMNHFSFKEKEEACGNHEKFLHSLLFVLLLSCCLSK